VVGFLVVVGKMRAPRKGDIAARAAKIRPMSRGNRAGFPRTRAWTMTVAERAG